MRNGQSFRIKLLQSTNFSITSHQPWLSTCRLYHNKFKGKLWKCIMKEFYDCLICSSYNMIETNFINASTLHSMINKKVIRLDCWISMKSTKYFHSFFQAHLIRYNFTVTDTVFNFPFPLAASNQNSLV